MLKLKQQEILSLLKVLQSKCLEYLKTLLMNMMMPISYNETAEVLDVVNITKVYICTMLDYLNGTGEQA